MHKVERAIILAAGIGKRMNPVTLGTPKPLVKVNGVRMIDTIIKALYQNDITEIYIVVGYLKEQFKMLTKKYPMVSLIENPYFESCNNISSLYVAREHLEEAMILDGDQIIYNQDILSPNFYCSGYNCVWTEDYTAEWLLSAEGNRIVSCSRSGGSKGWQLYSISRWTREDGRKLKEQLELEFEIRRNRQIYWDDVPMFCYFGEYELEIYPMNRQDVKEIDNIKELAAIDKNYLKYII